VDDESVHAIPLSGQDNQLLGILLVGNTRRPYVELRNRIRSVALLAASAGIILAILFSGWASSRVTRPVEQLAEAAREVAAGNWNTRVPVNSSDELGPESFSIKGSAWCRRSGSRPGASWPAVSRMNSRILCSLCN
jgi:HAMP domain-containing protein